MRTFNYQLHRFLTRVLYKVSTLFLHALRIQYKYNLAPGIKSLSNKRGVDSDAHPYRNPEDSIPSML